MNRTLSKIVTSTGAAMNIELGFVPNAVETRNITQWTQTSQNTNLFWNSNMADASYTGYATQSNITDGMKSVEDTTNGFTPYDTSIRTARQKVMSAATQANPCVVTSAGHGYTAAANDGDTILFNQIPSDSMLELNGNRYNMTYIDANSFSIDVDSTNFTTYSAATRGGIAINESIRNEDTGFKGITLGTIPAANNADVIELIISWDDQDLPVVP